MRRATRHQSRVDGRTIHISIHALHEESDLGSMWGNLNLPISIHALHEESDEICYEGEYEVCISIHALHEESDFFRG